MHIFAYCIFFVVFQCQFMVEKHEEDLEEFWFDVHAKKDDTDMHEWLCINKIKGEFLCPPIREIYLSIHPDFVSGL